MAKHHTVAVVLNPAAANGRVGKHIPALKMALTETVGDFSLLITERPGHATELTKQAVNDGAERIVSVGGDGTHNEVVNGLFAGKQPINPETRLAIVPYGTGADFSRTLRLPRGALAVRHLLEETPIRVDVGCVTHGLPNGGEAVRYFVNVADFGAGGEVVKRVNATSKFFGGFLSFLYGVVATLLVYRNPEMHIEIDGESIEGRCNNVIIANGQYYGGGMHVAPEARLDSGAFEVYVIGDVGRREAIVNLPKLYRGHLLKRADKVRYFFAKRIVARSKQRVLLDLDGEQPGQLPATIEVIPSVLNVLAPRIEQADEESA